MKTSCTLFGTRNYSVVLCLLFFKALRGNQKDARIQSRNKDEEFLAERINKTPAFIAAAEICKSGR